MRTLLRRTAKSIVANVQMRLRTLESVKHCGVVILGFHKIRAENDPLPLTLSPAIFAEVIKEILRTNAIISFDDFAKSSEALLSGPLKFILTFDDGYRDNYDFAWPILKELGVSATIFLSIDHIEHKRVFWYERLAHAVTMSQIKFLDLKALSMPMFDLQGVQARRRALLALNDRLKDIDDAKREEAVGLIVEELVGVGDSSYAGSPMLTWPMIREMRQGGIVFGSHTLSHCILSKESRERVRIELSKSKFHIERELGEEIRLLAYPNGREVDLNDMVIEEARLAGYSVAVTTQAGINQSGQDLFRLRRINLHNEAVNGVSAFSKHVFWRCVFQV